MSQFNKVQLAIDKVHTVPQRTLDCRPGLGGLTRFMGPIVPFPLFSVSIANTSDVQIGRQTGAKRTVKVAARHYLL